MAQKRLIRLAAIVNYFSDQTQIEEGEYAMQLNNIVRVHYNTVAREIVGYVWSNTKTEQYRVKLLLDAENNIKKAECSCRKEIKATCSHSAAIALYAHYCIFESLYTSEDSEIKSKQLENNAINYYPLPINDNHSYSSNNAINHYILPTDDNLSFNGKYSRSWSVSSLSVPSIGSLILSDEFHYNPDKKNYLQQQCAVSSSAIAYIANITIGQMDNSEWVSYRRFRLMDIHFGTIISAWQKLEYPPSLYEKLTGAYVLEKSEAIKWRKDHEAESVAAFTFVTGLHVTPTGLWLHPCGYLCASPDGLVGDNAIVEIKHPFSFRYSDLQVVLANDHSYICRYDVELKKFVINEDHDYYHQAQGQLYILNKQICYLAIWVPKQIIVMVIEKNPQWAHYIDILQDFYMNNFLKYMS